MLRVYLNRCHDSEDCPKTVVCLDIDLITKWNVCYPLFSVWNMNDISGHCMAHEVKQIDCNKVEC